MSFIVSRKPRCKIHKHKPQSALFRNLDGIIPVSGFKAPNRVSKGFTDNLGCTPDQDDLES